MSNNQSKWRALARHGERSERFERIVREIPLARMQPVVAPAHQLYQKKAKGFFLALDI